MKNKKFFLFSIPILLIFIIKEVHTTIVYLYNMALARSNKIYLTKMVDLKAEASVLYNDIEKEESDIENWLYNTPAKYYNIATFDDLILYGTAFIQNEFTDKTVIVIHGYGGYGEMMYYAAKKFYGKGYNVIVPDCRGHGKSQGSYIGMGWHDRFDIISWCEKVVAGNKNAEIILYGVSMGGAAVMMAAGESSLPDNVSCIIEDCGYTSVYDMFSYQIKKLYNINPFPVIDIVSYICKLRSNYGFKEASSVKQLKTAKVPMLFIHGGDDDFVPTEMMLKLYKSYQSEKDCFIVSGAGHGVSAMVDENNYWNKVFDFINKYV